MTPAVHSDLNAGQAVHSAFLPSEINEMKQIVSGHLKTGSMVLASCMAIASMAAQALPVGIQVLYTFHNQFSNPQGPYGTLLLANDGFLYGEESIAGYGGSGDQIFNMSTSGSLTVLNGGFSFYDQGSYGASLPSTLAQASDANLYGAATYGQNGMYASWLGEIFQLLPSGQVNGLYYFGNGSDGRYPMGGLAQGADGRFYGTTSAGGTGTQGTIFAVTSGGLLTTLHAFPALDASGYNTDGAAPKAGLFLASDGNFYGTTSAGGTYGYGTIFKLTPSGTFTVLRSLNTATDGANPAAPLHQASDGYLYGTAVNGGTYAHGTVFKISTAGAFTNLHSFALSDGANPAYGLVEAKIGITDYLFGSAPVGGANNNGVIYTLTTAGKFSVLYTFNSATDGGAYQPQGLTVGPDNNIYGVGAGSVFELITQKPTLTFKASPAYVSPSQPSNLTWSSTSATGCVASGNWSGSEPLSGSQSVVLTASGTYAYTLTCTGPAGSIKKTVKITVK